MKIKTIFILSIIILFVFLIYLTTLDKKVYYLALGDSLALGQTPYGNIDYGYTDYIKDYLKDKDLLEKYINEFASPSYRTTDIIRDIEDNKKIYINNKPQTLKNALIKADLVTLSIGLNDLLYKFTINDINKSYVFNHIDEMMVDMEKLFELLKKYCKEDIFIMGYYIPTVYSNNQDIRDYINYANKKLDLLAQIYKISFISVDKVLDEKLKYFPNPYNIHPTKQGYEEISELFIEKIEEKVLNWKNILIFLYKVVIIKKHKFSMT